MADSSQSFALTLVFDGIVEAIYSSIAIKSAVEEEDSSDIDLIWAKALWDTGATHTCISDRLATRLKLEVVDIVNIATANGIISVPTFFAHLKFPNNLQFSDWELSQFQFTNDDCDLIIGMDIITQGDFSITNVEGKTMFSFRVPTQQSIDYERGRDS
jgi:hypothetical protein